jgi:hypothetical protein
MMFQYSYMSQHRILTLILVRTNDFIKQKNKVSFPLLGNFMVDLKLQTKNGTTIAESSRPVSINI